MPINFDFNKLDPKYRDAPNDPMHWHPIANTMVQLSIILGFNEITSKNIDEVKRRIALYQKAFGGSLYFRHKLISLTSEDVDKFIDNFRINVSPISKSKFNSNLLDMMFKESHHFNSKPSAYDILNEEGDTE